MQARIRQKKGRFCLDQRQNNQIITPASSPLPLTDEFRRAFAADGYGIFSNLDLAQGYYKMKIETDNIDHLFGFRALGRVFIIKKISMGWGVFAKYLSFNHRKDILATSSSICLLG